MFPLSWGITKVLRLTKWKDRMEYLFLWIHCIISLSLWYRIIIRNLIADVFEPWMPTWSWMLSLFPRFWTSLPMGNLLVASCVKTSKFLTVNINAILLCLLLFCYFFNTASDPWCLSVSREKSGAVRMRQSCCWCQAWCCKTQTRGKGKKKKRMLVVCVIEIMWITIPLKLNSLHSF